MIRTWLFHGASPPRCVLLLIWATTAAQPSAAEYLEYSSFAGSEACRNCHAEQYRRWRGSHHDLAMQAAGEDAVLGDFDTAEFRRFGRVTRFFRRDGRFMVRTDGPDGEPAEFAIRYAFGVYPLQQYLLELPGGRLQALGIAWDARPEEAGGRRWFHLYDEAIDHRDPLHWTGPNQNWNHMCAECHSTQVEKNFDPQTRRYRTRFAEIDVGCEACHGPARAHAERAAGNPAGETGSDRGLPSPLTGPRRWTIDPDSGSARRSPPGTASREVELCARCHSRRIRIAAGYRHGRPLLDSHLPVTLDEGLYYADGQIRDEVYVYGSFVQSRMYREGVACSDCHEPHSLRLRAEGDALCTRCHRAERFAAPAHHFHETDRPGARCTACHMPERTFMQIDARADHSFRVPRPDLSDALGTPNACVRCHGGRTNQWAAAALTARGTAGRGDHYGIPIHAGRHGRRDAETRLIDLLGDRTRPAIARATAAKLLREYPSPGSIAALAGALQDDEPLIRHAALEAIEPLALADRLALAAPLLEDPVRAVRQESGRVLADARARLDEARRALLDAAVADYLAAQMLDADRPEAHLNRGNLLLRLGRPEQAERAFETALALDAGFAPAYVNLADLYRAAARIDDERELFATALRRVPDDPSVRHSYGLFLVRRGETAEALIELRKAAEAAPAQTRLQYAYALGLDATGRLAEAIEVLKDAHDRRPADRDVLFALASFHAKAGDRRAAADYAESLLELAPWDPNARALARRFESGE